ncbi:MAG: hypothetical protein JWP48_5876, partial [Actinoallomurus sp.]|nr:hypothetical protein [Actinoallomurus sp.]
MYVQVTPHIPKGSKAPTGVTLHVGSSQATVVFESNGKHSFGPVTSLSYEKLVAITVSVPSNMSTKRKVGVWAQADADNTPLVNASPSLSLPVKAKPKSSSSSSSGSSGSSGSSSGSSGTSLPTGNLNPSGTGASATPSTGTNSAVLPSIAAQTPTTAPGPVVQNTGASQSMRGTADAADQLTFD